MSQEIHESEFDPAVDQAGPFSVQFGAFKAGSFCLPYMATILRARQAQESLTLVSETPESLVEDWEVDELFQRDLDHGRVVEMARRYLNPEVATHAPFFNSLTVVLLPDRSLTKFDAPALASKPGERLAQIGPVSVKWKDADVPVAGSFGLLAWNRRQIRAVAIDGQHRLAAIKTAFSDSPARVQDMSLSVLFLCLDPKLGLAPNGDILRLMRQLFIDLNKHAQKVSRAREILLDDLDPQSIALRSTIGKRLLFKPSGSLDGLPTSEDGEFDTRIPLELVDWHGEQRAKVDRGPYATSVLALDWAYTALRDSRFLKLPIPEHERLTADSDSPDDAYFEKLEAIVRAGWREFGTGFASRVAAARDNKLWFSIDGSLAGEMGHELHGVWGRALTRLLTRAGPYRDLAQLRLDTKTLSPEFGTWYQAFSAAGGSEVGESSGAGDRAPVEDASKRLVRVEEILRTRGRELKTFRDVLSTAATKVKGYKLPSGVIDPNVLFFLTGQRAMVLALLKLFDFGSANKLAVELKRDAPKSHSDCAVLCAEILVSALSHYHRQPIKANLLRKSFRVTVDSRYPKEFWRGSAIKREQADQIDFSGAAAERTSRVLLTMALVHAYRRTNPGDEAIKAIRAWFKSEGKNSLAKDLGSSELAKCLADAVARFTGFTVLNKTGADANDFPMAFLVKYDLGDDKLATPHDLATAARARFDEIWAQAGGAS